MNSKDKIQTIKELANELQFGKPFGKPITLAETHEMESRLNVEFPPELREFLQTFGSLRVKRMEVDGYTIVQETLDLRENYPDTFPHNLVVVEGDGYGNYYCVVCDGKDYGKVIFWQHDAPLEGIYPKYPEGKPNFWIEGPDFWTWLLEELQRIKKIEDEEKQHEKEKVKE